MLPLVHCEWLKDNLDDDKLVILDATIKKVTGSIANDNSSESIPGSRFFDIKGSFSDKDTELPNMLPSPADFEVACRNIGINKDSIIVVYDRLGVYSSPRVWWMFRAMGHEKIAVLNGGFPAWKEKQFEVENNSNKVLLEGNFKADFQPQWVKSAEDVQDNITTAKSKVLDARSEGRFYGKDPEPRKGLKGGHIPGSLSLPYTELVKDGFILPKEELSARIESLMIGDAPLIFTCGSGITASILLLAFHIVNKNPKAVYDGSWSEWGLPELRLPIV